MTFPGYPITTDELNGSKELSGNDIIELTEVEGGSQDFIRINLTVQNSNWWKAVMLFMPSGDFSSIVTVAAFAPYVAEGIISPTKIPGNGIVLSKAGGLGIHTNVYHITNAAEYFKPGHIYTFNWKSAW